MIYERVCYYQTISLLEPIRKSDSNPIYDESDKRIISPGHVTIGSYAWLALNARIFKGSLWATVL